MKKSSTLAQGTTEYALILALVVLVVLVVLALFGKQLAAAYQKAVDGFRSTSVAASTPGIPATPVVASTPIVGTIQEIADDFMQRTLKYYQANGKWPPDSGDESFTALGLNPIDWKEPVKGIVWQPSGDYIGLTTPGDGTQVYVNEVKGKQTQLQLYDGWYIWCHAKNGSCYFHDQGLGREVDLNTVVVKAK